jgi:hypothetical protein
MSFFDEAIPMLRALINDYGPTLKYSDARLEELLCVSAKLVYSENISFDYTYSILISTHTISPDPIEIGDAAFFNFVCLRAACLSDVGTLRTKALLSGVTAKMGPASLETKGYADAFIKILETDGGPCKAYEKLKFEHMFGNSNICKVILSPFVSNDFDPANISVVDSSSRNRIME